MTQQTSTAGTASTPALHLPDLARAIMLLFGVGVLAKFTVFNEHLIFGPVAWIAFLGYVGLALAAAARIFLVDARGPGRPSLRVDRTRKTGVLTELVLAGTGGLFLIAPATFLAMTTSQELWVGRVQEPSSFSPIGLVFPVLFGIAGFFMTFWRPQFVLDTAARKIVRYAFGRSIPLRAKELPYSQLSVHSEGYFITNTGHRLGDMIRGRVGKYSFELEMVPGDVTPDIVQERAKAWAATLGAAYQTPDQAAIVELNGGPAPVVD